MNFLLDKCSDNGSDESGYILILVPFQSDTSHGLYTPDVKHFADAISISISMCQGAQRASTEW
jgi:hypothetical protein